MNLKQAYKRVTVAVAVSTVAFIGWIGVEHQSAQAQIPSVLEDGTPLPSLAPMIKRVSPAVVGIAVRGSVEVQRSPFFDRDFRRFFGIPDEEPRNQRRPFGSTGSGVIVDAENGYIITNAHVIENAEEIVVTLLDNRRLEAVIVGTDPASDVAVIKVEESDLTEIALGDSGAIEVGDFVVAIGNPFGQRNTVTSGIVSAKGRSNPTSGDNNSYQDFIQTDASINPGNSGGALVNLRGELVGINSQIISTSGGNVGIGFAIPVNMASSLMAQLIEYGEVSRGLLGVRITTLTPAEASVWDTDITYGALVEDVEDGSAAEKAGVEPGDVIVGVNGRTVKTGGDLRNQIGLLRVGAKAELDVLRNGRPKTIVARVGSPGGAEIIPVARNNDEDRPKVVTGMHPGLDGAELADTDEEFGSDLQGVVVLGVERGSRAASSGLRSGDVITSIKTKGRPSKKVDSVEGLRDQLESGRDAVVRVERRDGSGNFLLLRAR